MEPAGGAQQSAEILQRRPDVGLRGKAFGSDDEERAFGLQVAEAQREIPKACLDDLRVASPGRRAHSCLVLRSGPVVPLSPLEAVDHAVRECAIAGETDGTGGIEWRHHADEVALFELLVDERRDGLAHQVGTRCADVQLVEKEREDAVPGSRAARAAASSVSTGGGSAPPRRWNSTLTIGRRRAVLEHVEICGLQAEHGVARAISDHHIAAPTGAEMRLGDGWSCGAEGTKPVVASATTRLADVRVQAMPQI